MSDSWGIWEFVQSWLSYFGEFCFFGVLGEWDLQRHNVKSRPQAGHRFTYASARHRFLLSRPLPRRPLH